MAGALLLLTLLAPATAAAKDGPKDRPMADHERTITVAALRLTNPMVQLDYEQALSDKTSFSVGAGYGRYNSLWLRLVNSLASDADVALRIPQVSATGAYTYYFKGFNRGWYTGGTLEYDRYTPRVEAGDEEADTGLRSFSNLTVGPHIGYKIATKKGFTFSWDTGGGYQFGFGDAATQDFLFYTTPRIASSRFALLGSLNLGWSF
jgi:hypothetical protein